MFLLLIFATAVVLAVSAAVAYRRSRDVFHPLMFLAPMLGVLYVYLPLAGIQDDSMLRFIVSEDLQYAQMLFALGTCSICLGCLKGSPSRAGAPKRWNIPHAVRQRLFIAAILLGSVAVICWIITLANAGGFQVAYGRAYGGGTSESGYIRDAVYFSVPALILVHVSRLGVGYRIWDLAASVIFGSPLLVQGLFGARRGPIFMLATVVGMGWYLLRFKRPKLLVLLAGGISLGVFLLFLVSNRENIYLGSDLQLDKSPTEYLRVSSGNEYVYGAGVVMHYKKTNAYYWGRRYFAIVFIRPIPIQLWPDKYEAVGLGQVTRNLGLGDIELRSSMGWVGARGAAPGIIADLFAEVSWYCLILLFLLGWAYARVWWYATRVGGFWIIAYSLMSALSIFLVMQTLEAMLVRFLWMTTPSLIIWKWAFATKGQQVNLRVSAAQTRTSSKGRLTNAVQGPHTSV